jgi:quercetin dioxygenase-like cupin family protein
MQRARATLIALVAAAAIAAGTAGAQTADKAKPAAKPAAAPAKHVMVAASDVKWGPGPPSLPPGAQMGVLDGDPSVAGKPFVVRVKFPDGYRVPPHWHPTEENIVVLSGSFLAGIGDTFNEGTMMTLAPGGYAKMPKEVHHYAMAKGETVLQLHGTGPFTVTYVNPKDDPRNKK